MQVVTSEVQSTVFVPFEKIPRFRRAVTITEKIDGTNALVHVLSDGTVLAGSRTRYIVPGKTTDNYGFAQWVKDNEEELRWLGEGRHYGEWWGRGIQRGYGLVERRFSLFNTSRHQDRPNCCEVVPVLYAGLMADDGIESSLKKLRTEGSQACNFHNPEGIVIFHSASGRYYKITLEKDESPKLVH